MYTCSALGSSPRWSSRADVERRGQGAGVDAVDYTAFRALTDQSMPCARRLRGCLRADGAIDEGLPERSGLPGDQDRDAQLIRPNASLRDCDQTRRVGQRGFVMHDGRPSSPVFARDRPTHLVIAGRDHRARQRSRRSSPRREIAALQPSGAATTPPCGQQRSPGGDRPSAPGSRQGCSR